LKVVEAMRKNIGTGSQFCSKSSKHNWHWVHKGPVSATECFSCANMADYRITGEMVSILCRDLCNYKPLEGKARLGFSKGP